jgi:hypothetical protein
VYRLHSPAGDKESLQEMDKSKLRRRGKPVILGGIQSPQTLRALRSWSLNGCIVSASLSVQVEGFQEDRHTRIRAEFFFI